METQPRDLVEFSWYVPRGGFTAKEAWVKHPNDNCIRHPIGRPGVCVIHRDGQETPQPPPPPNETLLVQNQTTGVLVYRAYRPLLECPSLFRTFAETPRTPAGVLGFATQYGHLGIHAWPGYACTDEPLYLTEHVGERLSDWYDQIALMNQTVMLWDLLREKDEPGLSRYIRWGEEEVVFGRKQDAGWTFDSRPELPPPHKQSHEERLKTEERVYEAIPPPGDLFRPNDVFMPALFLVQRRINTVMREAVSAHLRFDPHKGKQVLSFAPSNLRAAMWLMFAQAIDQNKEFRACKECGKWFAISAEEDGRTARRQFCSEPCKSRDYRHRKEEAGRRKAAGESLAEIAVALGTDQATICKWVSGAKKKR